MAKRNIGQVGFRDRGDYSDDDTYRKWDMVIFEGSTYVCSINEQDGLITGMSPFDYPSNWKCIAQGGKDGIDGKDGMDGEKGVVVLQENSYGFTVRNGDLILTYNDNETPPNLHINDDGYLILTIE